MGFMGRSYGSEHYWKAAETEEERRKMEQNSHKSLEAAPILGGIAVFVLLGVILTVLGL